MALPTGGPVFISLGGRRPNKSGGGAVLLLLLLLVVVLVVAPFVVLMTAPCWLHDKAPKAFDTLKDAAIKMKLKDKGYSIDEEDCDAQE
jgi:hypothetical protein